MEVEALTMTSEVTGSEGLSEIQSLLIKQVYTDFCVAMTYPAVGKLAYVKLRLTSAVSDKWFRVLAMVDTGCQTSCVSFETAQSFLRLQKLDQKNINLLTREVDCKVTGFTNTTIPLQVALVCNVDKSGFSTEAVMPILPRGCKKFQMVLGVDLINKLGGLRGYWMMKCLDR